jgi:hypothetical protein
VLTALAAAAAFTGHLRAQASLPAVAADSRASFDIRTDKERGPEGYRERFAVHAALGNGASLRASGLGRLHSEVKGVQVTKGHDLGTLEIVGMKPGSGFLTRAGADNVATLKGFLGRYGAAFGVSASGVDSLDVVSEQENPSGTMAWVELEQRINGLPVFQGNLRGGFTARGELARTTGRLAAGLSAARLDVDPTLTAAEAVERASAHVGWGVSARALTQKSVDAKGRITLARGTLADDATAWLTYFPLAPGVARLAWATEIWGDPDVFLVLLDAEDGTILYRKSLTDFQTQSATYAVYDDDSPAPASPSPALPGANYQAPSIARSMRTLIGNEALFSFNNLGWMTDGTNATDGNNVEAGLDRVSPDGVDATVAGVGRVFDFTYDSSTDDPRTTLYQQGEVTQLFYLTNRFHDLTYLLGFTEAARNFQHDNFGRGGVGFDRIRAEGQDYSGTDNANFSTPTDGGRGRMQMYLFTGPTPDRTSGIDRDIVFHELAHGLSNRLHANASGLNTTMSRGMGEGWSDFYARALTATADEDVNGIYTVGGWSTQLMTSGFTDNYYYGIRRFPYAVKTAVGSNGKPHNPLTFADIDPTQINLTDGAYPRGPIGSSTAFAVHNIGEVWAMALFEVRARLITRLGFDVGNQRILQFVTDGMKLDPASPTLLQGRDSILAAAAAGGGTADDIADIWAGFATRGMGVLASVVDASTGRVIENFNVPSDSLPTFTVNDITVAEGDSGTTTATYTVTLANPNGAESSVNYAISDGTASSASTVTSATSIAVPGTGSGGATGGSPGNPYPATVDVSGVTGTLQRVAVRLNSVTHTWPEDMDVLLVGPGGQQVMLMSDAGGSSSISGVTFTFVDGASAMTAGQLATGTYAPTDRSPGETLAAPAPAGPYATALSVFNGTDPNGTWRLYAVDDVAEDTGSIGGFSLILTTANGDHVPSSGQLTFPAGTTTRTVSVTVNGDTLAEPDETFFIDLSGPRNAVIGDARGVATIVDDDGSVPAAMTSPAGGSSISNPASFTWSTGSGVLEYWLDVGTSAGGTQIYTASQGLATTRSVTGIPTNGVTVHVRLWSRLASGWTSVSYTYIGGSSPATMLSPTPGSSLVSTTTAFTWTPGTAVSQIWLSVGTTPGGTQIYNASQGTATSRTVSGLPHLGVPLYARLWSFRSGSWSSIDYTYTSVDHRSRLALPSAGGTLPGSTATFRWTAGSGVTQRWLYLGTSVGAANLYNADLQTLAERTISGLPTNGSTLYARLFSRINGSWVHVDSSFRAADPLLARLMSPVNGSTLTAATATFTWTIPTGVTQVWLSLGATVGGTTILNANKGTSTSHTASGLPVNGSAVYARLWTLRTGAWKYVDYYFHASGGSRATLLLPAAGGVLPGATATFRWTAGAGVTTTWLYIGTGLGASNLYNAEQFTLTERTIAGLPTTGVALYARLWSLMGGVWHYADYSFRAADSTVASLSAPANGTTLSSASVAFSWVKPVTVTQTWLYIGTGIGLADLANVNSGAASSYAATGLPVNGGAVYLRLWSLQGGVWQWRDYHFTAAGAAASGE